MAETTITEFVPYQPEKILEDIITRFINKGYTDADQVGSNAHNISTIITGALSMLGLNLNHNISEALISTATKETNILKNAQSVLGYSRIKNVSYQYQVKFKALMDTTLLETDETKRNYILPRYTKFSSNGNDYYYFGDNIVRSLSNKDILDAITESFFEITVKEGTLYKYSDYTNLNYAVQESTTGYNNSYFLPYQNIEEDGVELFVTYSYSGEFFTDQKWVKSSSMLIENTTEEKKFIVLDDIDSGYNRIFWRYSNVGIVLPVGSILKMNVLISKGTNGKSDGAFTTTLANFEFDTFISTVMTGVNTEDKNSVAENAPRFNNSANRAVTREDYLAISNRRPEILTTAVWGSEDELPRYSKYVWLSYVPSYRNRNFVYTEVENKYSLPLDGSHYLSDTEIQNIHNYYVPYKIPGIKYNNRHPNYINIEFDMKVVRYDSKLTIFETNKNIFDTVSLYFETTIEKFGAEYFNATVIKRINETTSDISGLNIFPKISSCISTKNFEYAEINNPMALDPLVPEPINVYKYILHLSYGYDYPFNLDYSLKSFNLLPSIDTLNFADSGFDLYTNFGVGLEHYYETELSYDIKINNTGDPLTDTIIGKYIIVSGDEEYIRIELYISETLTDEINVGQFAEHKLIDLKYTDINGNPSDNFSAMRNSLIRLTRVQFIV